MNLIKPLGWKGDFVSVHFYACNYYHYIWCWFRFQEQLTLGALPPSRFILATLGVLVAEHHAHSLSLLLNSGLLALTQSILRLAGEWTHNRGTQQGKGFAGPVICLMAHMSAFVQVLLCLWDTQQGKGLSFAGAATSIFVMTKDVFCRSKSVLAVTNVLSQQDYVCCNEHTFDMTQLLLWQTRVCHNEHTFVTTKDLFFCDKCVFVTTKVSLLQQKFCCNKNMFVTTKLLLQQTYFCRNKRCVLSNTCLLWQTCVCRLLRQKLYLWLLPPMIKALLVQWSAWWIVSLHLW